MHSDALTDVSSHFHFGENWSSYANLIDAERLHQAKEGLRKLIPSEELAGSRFLDIGSGSGIHSCAAALLGASKILAIDIDPVSVDTTRRVLKSHAADGDFEAIVASVFDLDPDQVGRFDIVYSWGVLHHTGHMQEAIRKAAALVTPGGLLVIALYRSTYLDWAWKLEKEWYTKASAKWQRRARVIYSGLFQSALVATGKSLRERPRGMDYWHDIHDWLGGYPYESILAPELECLLKPLGFSPERVWSRPKGIGLFGSGNDEYAYRRL